MNQIALIVVVQARTEKRDGTVQVELHAVNDANERLYFNYGVFTSEDFPAIKDLMAGDRLTLTLERAEPADISTPTTEDAARPRLALA